MQESRNFDGRLYLKNDFGELVSNVDNIVFWVEEHDLGIIEGIIVKNNRMLQEFSAEKDRNYLSLIYQWMELCGKNPHEQLKHKFNGTLYDNINNKKYHVEGLFPTNINGADPTKIVITFKYDSKVEEG